MNLRIKSKLKIFWTMFFSSLIFFLNLFLLLPHPTSPPLVCFSVPLSMNFHAHTTRKSGSRSQWSLMGSTSFYSYHTKFSQRFFFFLIFPFFSSVAVLSWGLQADVSPFWVLGGWKRGGLDMEEGRHTKQWLSLEQTQVRKFFWYLPWRILTSQSHTLRTGQVGGPGGWYWVCPLGRSQHLERCPGEMAISGQVQASSHREESKTKGRVIEDEWKPVIGNQSWLYWGAQRSWMSGLGIGLGLGLLEVCPMRSRPCCQTGG